MTSPAHDRYLRDAVMTASPGKLLVMLYDRLVKDLMHGESALRAGDRYTASRQLLHAQDIIVELRSSLDVESWSGGPALASLYTFMLTELIDANVKSDPDRVASCRTLVIPLLEAWREAVVLCDADRMANAQPVGAGRVA